MEYVSGNIFIREMSFLQKGEEIGGHAHNFDHTTYVVRGALLIESFNEDGSVKKSVVKKASDGHNWVLIKAGVQHRLTALEENSMGHCIYAHRNSQAEIVQSYDGWMEGYL